MRKPQHVLRRISEKGLVHSQSTSMYRPSFCVVDLPIVSSCYQQAPCSHERVKDYVVRTHKALQQKSSAKHIKTLCPVGASLISLYAKVIEGAVAEHI